MRTVLKRGAALLTALTLLASAGGLVAAEKEEMTKTRELNEIFTTADLMDAVPLFNLALLVLGNVTFLLLDLALERLSALWRRKLRKRFFR